MRRGKINFQNTIINDGMNYDTPLIQSTETLALYVFQVTESNSCIQCIKDVIIYVPVT